MSLRKSVGGQRRETEEMVCLMRVCRNVYLQADKYSSGWLVVGDPT